LSPDSLPNFCAPADFSSKWTAGMLFSSRPGFATRRSEPVTGAILRTTYHVVAASAPAPAEPGITSRSPGRLPLYCFSRSSFDAGPASTSLNSRIAVWPMMSLARATSLTPGICTRISSPDCRAMLGSVTPSSLTRRSIVSIACSIACSRRSRSMVAFILNS
jgi:hypothetical protein